ncbi:glycosyltransferase [bacterium]|nr:glycosyltransferase [bacterium]
MSIRQDARSRYSPHSAIDPVSTGDQAAGLRVALVHDWLTGLRGGEKCLERLCRIFPDATIHTLIHDPGKCGPVIEAMKIRTSPLQRIPGVMRHYRKLLPIMPWAIGRIDVGQPDLVISLSHCVAKAVRVPEGVPHICYCFTPMRYAWDGREAYLDRWPSGSMKRILAEKLLNRLARWDASTAHGVTRFIAISRTIQDRIERNYRRESDVVAPPVDTDYYRPDPQTAREDFYLAASALVPYKRIDQAVEACRRSGKKLVVIGQGPEFDRLKAMANNNIQFLGHCPDEVLRDHMRRCRALLFPGDEDFGILPIEALACGTPVIALDSGGVAETVDSTVGRLFPDPTVESLCKAILDFESRGGDSFDPFEARRKAERFSGDRFDEGILKVLRQVMTEHKGHTMSAKRAEVSSVSR